MRAAACATRRWRSGWDLGVSLLGREDCTCRVCGQGTVEDLQHFCSSARPMVMSSSIVFQCLHRRTPRWPPFLGHQPQTRLAICAMRACLPSANACCQTDATLRLVSGGFRYEPLRFRGPPATLYIQTTNHTHWVVYFAHAQDHYTVG
jgi:hypothetical protein